MRRAAALVALIGLAVSVASLVDQSGGAPAFCAEEGCGEVRSSAWAHPLGIPLPILGIGFFAAAVLLAAAGPRAASIRRGVAAVGGAVGIGLIAVQAFAIGTWCALCLVADLGAIVHAALVLARRRPWPRLAGAQATALAAGAALAVAFPLVAASFGHRSSPAPPPPGAQVAGVALVVDFVDFECPFCRAVDARLKEAVATAGVPVRVERRMVPLSRHRGAMPAALAWCAADAQGAGDSMADALFAAAPATLTRAGCEAIATELGLDLERYRRDVAAPATSARIEADRAAARSAGVRGLPTLHIGHDVLVGGKVSTDAMVAALRRAARS